MRDSNFVMRDGVWLAGALISAISLKGWLLWRDVVPFNADEAIVALMARHILQGEHPLFFYGQAYLGSLDAWLVALGFAVLGEQVWVIRLVQGLLFMGTIVTTAMIGKRVYQSHQVGGMAACLVAIPTVNVTLYTTVSLGGYGEALLIGNLILILTLRIANKVRLAKPVASWEWLVWGFLIGFGWWIFGLTLVYSLPAGLYLLWILRDSGKVGRAWILAVLGGVAGSSPWWIYVVQNGLSLPLGELSGSAIAGVEGLSYYQQIGQHLISFLVLGSTVTFGFRPPWGTGWLGLPLLPFVLFLWMVILLYSIRTSFKDRKESGDVLLWGVMVTFTLAFIFTPFGADPSGRYFLPLAIPLSLLAARWIVSHKEASSDPRLAVVWWGPLVLLLAYHLWGTIQSAFHYPPGITTQFYEVTQIDQRSMPALVHFLQEHGETRGYTNYWIAYPMAFLSAEELIYIPRLPYHLDLRYTYRDDRYAPYDEIIAQSGRVAYITSHHSVLDELLRARFSARGLKWQEANIGDFHVFFNLSRPIRPQEIGLGETNP